jgi:Flp pilus assembly pilin Flp
MIALSIFAPEEYIVTSLIAVGLLVGVEDVVGWVGNLWQ